MREGVKKGVSGEGDGEGGGCATRQSFSCSDEQEWLTLPSDIFCI